jgi:hypothetical protein
MWFKLAREIQRRTAGGHGKSLKWFPGSPSPMIAMRTMAFAPWWGSCGGWRPAPKPWTAPGRCDSGKVGRDFHTFAERHRRDVSPWQRHASGRARLINALNAELARIAGTQPPLRRGNSAIASMATRTQCQRKLSPGEHGPGYQMTISVCYPGHARSRVSHAGRAWGGCQITVKRG